jgi:hypothetical protein
VDIKVARKPTTKSLFERTLGFLVVRAGPTGTGFGFVLCLGILEGGHIRWRRGGTKIEGVGCSRQN